MKNKGCFPKGNIPWNKGKKVWYVGELSPTWKGDKAGYNAIHMWIRRHFVRTTYCEKCHATVVKRFEWANLSGEYRRDRDDWMNVCSVCHKAIDAHIYQRSRSNKLKEKK